MGNDSEMALLGFACGITSLCALAAHLAWPAVHSSDRIRKPRSKQRGFVAAWAIIGIAAVSVTAASLGGIDFSRGVMSNSPRSRSYRFNSEPFTLTAASTRHRSSRAFGDGGTSGEASMDTSKLWKRLTDEEQRAWRVWAKTNPVITDAGEPARVNAFAAFDAVLKRRALAGEPLNATTPPNEAKWIGSVLSLRDAGPFTTGQGYFGFRAESNIATDTCWFVWATPPVDESEAQPEQLLQFVTQFRAAPMEADEVTENLGPTYRSVLGSWAGPGEEGAWPAEKYIWVRMHEYVDGQLGPAVLLRGRIQVEL